jgi:hypothetical protein
VLAVAPELLMAMFCAIAVPETEQKRSVLNSSFILVVCSFLQILFFIRNQSGYFE